MVSLDSVGSSEIGPDVIFVTSITSSACVKFQLWVKFPMMNKCLVYFQRLFFVVFGKVVIVNQRKYIF